MEQSNQEMREISFTNGNRAKLVTVQAETNPADIISALGVVPPKIMIVISGGAGKLADNLKPRLTPLFTLGIARVAAELDALIVDGGTQSGVMEMMGQGVAELGRPIPLLGVAPAQLVTYPGQPTEKPGGDTSLDPNHSHFVLVNSNQWGGETKTMYDLAAALGEKARVVTVLVNGGAIAKQEVLRSVRLGWPVIVIEESERLADEIAAIKTGAASTSDEALQEIVDQGDLHFFKLSDSVSELQQLLKQHLGYQLNPTLADAWQCFALYDQNADEAQKRFVGLRKWILALGVIATFLPVAHSMLSTSTIKIMDTPLNSLTQYTLAGIPLDGALKLLIIIAPISLSILVAGSAKFERGGSWVLLRNGAETIKREIYRYRAQVEIYKSTSKNGSQPRDLKLARKIKLISQRLMKTQVNQTGLKHYNNPLPPPKSVFKNDGGFSDLTPDTYLPWRLEDQLKWYQGRTVTLSAQAQRLYWSIYILGGIGTLLAAVGFEIWIAVTVAISSALTAFLELRRIESTLTTYNQVATDLANIRTWWHALSAREKKKYINFEKLVQNTENIIASEHTGWVQEMRDALSQLYGEVKKSDEPAEKG